MEIVQVYGDCTGVWRLYRCVEIVQVCGDWTGVWMFYRCVETVAFVSPSPGFNICKDRKRFPCDRLGTELCEVRI